ncbi:MAG: threonine--tRNA ligase [Candidatus Aenigmarchaeota archaeon]|nr:threonine--tRNA ligase [Candidatus Aenigmarchaeota archaeon]
MKILLIHSDFIQFEAWQKAIKQAEEWQKGQKTRVDDCLVVFTAVEKRDEGNIAQVTKNMIDEVEKVAKEIKADKLVFYPYAHLSKDLSSPATALEALRKAEETAKERGFESFHAPFGWYKAFEIKAKGHPLSELSREITVEGPAASATKKKGGAQLTQAGETKELSEDDHRLLGKKLDLYSFHDVAPGMTFFHPKGMIIRNELMSFWRSEHAKRGYSEINTPLIMNKSLWQMSGHWDHYKENMFFTTIDDVEFAVKPMNCPGAITVFNSSTRSYRDLPMKLAELGQVHRNELSGVLSGLFRLRYFTQDDSHIFVREDQLEQEIMNVVDTIEHFYGIFGFQYHVELSTRPDNSIGSKEIWDKAEKALEDALKAKKMNYKINPKDGAFYGPKIDFHIKDSLGRTWQCATCQVDFMLPERFDAKYIGEDNKPHRPVIIHRVIYGAIERFIGILVEHYKGAFPVWLSPVQVRVLALTDNNNAAVERIVNMLRNQAIRADTDMRPSTVEYRVREAELQKIPYIIVIGEREEQSGTVAVRSRGTGKVQFGVKPDAFLAKLKEEIEKKA